MIKNIPETSNAPGVSLEEFMEFFSKESSRMRRFFPRRCGAPLAMTSHYLYTRNEAAFPVIQGNRNRGMPTRRGVNRRISEDLLEKNSSEFFDCGSPQERQTPPTKKTGSIGSANAGILYQGALP
jgi:hypothetical protein